MDNNRRTAYEVLMAVETEGAYSNIALNDAVKRRSPDDEAFVRTLVYGVIENQIYLDYKLSHFVRSGLKKVRPQALILMRMGAYQLEFLGGVPDYASISETVKIAKKVCRGLEGFINGVLRAYQRGSEGVPMPDEGKDPAGALAVRYSYTEDLAELGLRMFGRDEAERLMAAGNEAPPLTVRVNRLKTDAETLAEDLRSRGFGAEIILDGMALELKGTGVLRDVTQESGLFSVQDVSSMEMIRALNPQPGETVLDVCAAPGGKSLAAAEWMENRGRVISCDVYDHKLKLIEKAAERLGVTILETQKNDGTVRNENFVEIADKVIVDAPCSGLGVVRRKPEIKLRIKRKDMEKLAEVQLKILENSAGYLRENGTLIYSTCTVSDIENRGVIDRFLKKNKNFSIVLEKQLLPYIDSSDGFYFCALQRFQ